MNHTLSVWDTIFGVRLHQKTLRRAGRDGTVLIFKHRNKMPCTTPKICGSNTWWDCTLYYIDDALAIFWNMSWVKDIPCVGFCGLPTCLFPPHFVLILGLEVLLGAFLSINLLENRPVAGFLKTTPYNQSLWYIGWRVQYSIPYNPRNLTTKNLEIWELEND